MASFRPLAVLVGVLLSQLLFACVAAKDEAVLSAEIGRLNNQSLLWGPYRPNLYFGVRPRLPHSLMTALMWSNLDTFNGPKDSQSPLPLSLSLARRPPHLLNMPINRSSFHM